MFIALNWKELAKERAKSSQLELQRDQLEALFRVKSVAFSYSIVFH